jgi:hypothetical protein
MKKQVGIFLLAGAISIAVSGTAFALTGSWEKDDTGYRYKFEDDTYAAADTWIYDNDATWYHFGNDGYMETGTRKINGYTYVFSDSGALTASNVTLDKAAEEFPEAVNGARKAAGVPELTMNEDLTAAAETRAAELEIMFTTQERPNGEETFANELILWGDNTAYAVVDAWEDSLYNRAVLMNPDVSEMGCAAYMGSDGRTYWDLILQ